MNRLLPLPLELAQSLPLQDSAARFITDSRQTLQNILEGKDSRLLLIVGPCSVHDRAACLEYAGRLGELQASLENIFLVMRTYFEKPRTLHGWKGLLNDPHLDGSHDIFTGLRWTRELLLALASMGIPCATEFLEPLTHVYFDDLITWGCVGARTTTSQPHRQMASHLAMPVGFKNTTEGNVDVAIHGVISARHPHHFVGLSPEGHPQLVASKGNPFPHIVLRGGGGGANYHANDVQGLVKRLEEQLVDPCLIIDCSHDNSGKSARRQQEAFRAAFRQVCTGVDEIRGLMLESHLHQGKQSLQDRPSELRYGVSVTDECIGWKETADLLLWADEALGTHRPCVANASP